jgi:glycyl-tRNA synthetase beta chain
MPELLLELFSEEIPARMQARAAEDLQRLVTDGLKSAGLTFETARNFVTPRRLAVVVDGLPAMRPDVEDERRGPRVGAPDNAIQGFLKGAGLTSIEECEKRDTGKGEFWFAVIRKKGGPTADLLPDVLLTAIRPLSWPKSMKWGSGSFTWVRPLHSIVALFDGHVLPGALELGGDMKAVAFGNTTRGHRFLGNVDFKVTDFDDYAHGLLGYKVVLDRERRKELILTGAEALARDAQVTLQHHEGLLEEVAGLVEWPVPMLGTIDAAFMDLPPEVLITSMRTHQRYFACTNSDGSLANRFVVVANTIARDGGTTIVAGNERVLRARLSDAKFFWDQDRKVALAERLPSLQGIVFHARLGTQGERVDRIVALAKDVVARETGGFFKDADVDQVAEAARLAKADLVSGMVGEFPELQGVMGRYYARAEKLPDAVCEAIGEHYSPLGPGDRCPSAPVSVAVALADKLDALTGFWAIDEKPTGSRDPFALRRAALGVIRLVQENGLRLSLRSVARAALLRHRPKGNDDDSTARERVLEAQAAGVPGHDAAREKAADTAVDDLMGFLADRLKVQMREQGVRHDLVDAVFALSHEDDLVRLLARVRALQDFLAKEDGRNLLVAYGRAANIVRAEEKKDKGLAGKLSGAPDVAQLEANEERAVAAALATADATAEPALAREDFGAAMAALAQLRVPVDAFFDKVTVNVTDKPDLRLNRLKLLNRIRATVDRVADFSRVEG